MLCGVQERNILPEPCRQLAYTQKHDIQLPLLFQHAKQQEVVNDCMKLSSLLKNLLKVTRTLHHMPAKPI